jgi:hypothetical protein
MAMVVIMAPRVFVGVVTAVPTIQHKPKIFLVEIIILQYYSWFKVLNTNATAITESSPVATNNNTTSYKIQMRQEKK